ncbi:MAG: D-alanyl-D-alanine carboxypeptidase [Oscillospiraceae bacterium]|nr:D-alanyl-D-alanine carboxypeptidase [Oscillospiraceae bacterium]
MLRRSFCVLVSFLLVPGILCFGTETEDNKQYISSYVLAEATTGTILEESSGDEKVPVGVMTKLMTILLAAEENKKGGFILSDKVAVSANANSKQGAQIWLMPGEEITAEELMKGIIIGNANDAAAAVAEKISGTEEKFTAAMNEKARQLGMNNTVFTNPDGYYDSSLQVSTAADMALLTCELSGYSCFDEYFLCKLDYIRNNETMLVNSNRLVGKYNGLKGYKTGYAEASGYCGAFLAERDGKAYAAVLLGYEDEDEMLSHAVKLLDKGFSSYRLFTPEIPEELPVTIPVKNGSKNRVRVDCEKISAMMIKTGEADEITAMTVFPEYVYAPVKRGDKLGEILYYKKDRYVFSSDIIAEETVDKNNLLSVIVILLKKISGF